MNKVVKRMCITFLLFFISNSYAADDGSAQNQSIWPVPKFYFAVEFGSGLKSTVFQEVSGLDLEVQPIEYRHSNSKVFSTVKMPGIKKSGNITLKKGIFIKDNQFFDWYKTIKMNTVKRETIKIKLLDETGQSTMIWTLQNAWPTKITGTDLKSDGNEVAVEIIELAHEGITFSNN